MAARSPLNFARYLLKAQQAFPSVCARPGDNQSGAQLRGLSSLWNWYFRPGSDDRADFDRAISTISRTGCVSSFFSIREPISILQSRGCGSLSLTGKRLSSATSSGRTVLYSSLALERQDDETVQQAADIGYKVLGQYSPVGPRIKPQAAFAVVQVGSHQFKVSPGDMIYTEKLKYADINDEILLNKVLLLGSSKQTIIGRPVIPDAGVFAAVEEHALDEKVIIFKKKRRKNYRRTRGHRQELTRLRILHIDGIEAPPNLEGQ